MIAHFLEYLQIERHYSELTVKAYAEDLAAFCAFLGWTPEEFDPNQIDEQDIRTWVLDMIDNGASRNTKSKGSSARTVKRRLSALKSFYKYLLRIGKVKVDITQRIIAPKAHTSLPVFFRETEMEKEETLGKVELSQAADPQDAFLVIRDNLIIDMLYQTGMRRAEIIALTDADIDIYQHQIRVFGKRRKERIVPIGDKLAEQITVYRQLRNTFLSSPPSNGQPLLVKIKRDSSVVPLSATDMYNIVCARMGEVSTLDKHSPHVLRHTFATTMLNNGADIRTIQTLLGHSSLAATQVYTHTTFEQIQKAYKNAHPRSKGGSIDE